MPKIRQRKANHARDCFRIAHLIRRQQNQSRKIQCVERIIALRQFDFTDWKRAEKRFIYLDRLNRITQRLF